jgi:hypothetical protein
MKEPGKRKRSWMVDGILILLVIILGYFLYSLVGGDWNAITQIGSPGDPGPFGDVAGSMGAFGRGLNDMFGNITP